MPTTRRTPWKRHASGDRTGEICERCQKSHPDRIVLVRERKNQYQTGRKITTQILLPLVQSPFAAFLEGDDRWLIRDKLERQVRFLMQDPSCTLVCTGIRVQEAGSRDREKENHPAGLGKQPAWYLPSGVYPLTLREVFEDGESLHTQFSSFAARTKALRRIPSSLQHWWFGDWILVTSLALQGTILYWDRKTALYRIHSRESTADHHQDDRSS